jgi:hypothetical protein
MAQPRNSVKRIPLHLRRSTARDEVSISHSTGSKSGFPTALNSESTLSRAEASPAGQQFQFSGRKSPVQPPFNPLCVIPRGSHFEAEYHHFDIRVNSSVSSPTWGPNVRSTALGLILLPRTSLDGRTALFADPFFFLVQLVF